MSDSSLPSEAPRLDDPEFERLLNDFGDAYWQRGEGMFNGRAKESDARAALRARVAQLIEEAQKEGMLIQARVGFTAALPEHRND
jgi:hypothetical protein